jgi:acyl carrier protein
MTNIEKYNNAYIQVFGVETSKLNDDFGKESVGEWDSVHQLGIVANIEEVFDIMLEPEDIMALVSYKAGKEILGKYQIEL